MGKFLTLAVVLAAALTFGAATGTATTADEGLDGQADVEVTCTWDGDAAKVVVLGTPGQSYAAFDGSGTSLAAGVLETGKVRFMVGTSGVGPSGSMVFVVVDDEIVATTDPDWEWN